MSRTDHKYLFTVPEEDPFVEVPREVAIVVTRASSVSTPEELEMSKLSIEWFSAATKGYFMRESGVACFWFVHMDNKKSIDALPRVGNEKDTGKYAEIGTVGLSTSYDSIIPWIQDMQRDHQPSKITLHFHEMKKQLYTLSAGLELAKLVVPIRQGRGGWSVDVPVEDLLSDKQLPAGHFCSVLRRFWAEVNAAKESKDRGLACPKNRNILRRDDREAIQEERLFGAAV
ncbi:hypothetical protein KCU77_g5154, partial [Aureobasidium melanogenum]